MADKKLDKYYFKTIMKRKVFTIALAALTIGLMGSCSKENPQHKLPEGALPGEFSVSATRKVHFSKGNLVATIDASGAPTAWMFAAKQYDYLGEDEANQTIGSVAGDVDLFGWSTDAISNNWGIHTKTEITDGVTDGNFNDWGKNIGDGKTWRTLSNEEWQYLFDARTNASDLYKFGVTVCGKTNCLVIAPDNWDTTANPLQESYDESAWATAETEGLVCLPAAGYRKGLFLFAVDNIGNYWSSSPCYDDYAYCVCFLPDIFYYTDENDTRELGESVRLITECQ